jgi:anti-sigma regulatory factor (Ser/Thr protein kinase)
LVRAEGSRLIFEGNLKSDTRAALVCMYQLTQKLGYQDIELDFSDATYVDANLMLPLLSYALYYRKNYIDFELIEPSDPKLKRLFTNTNWSYFIKQNEQLLHNKRRMNNLPALQFTDGRSQFQAVNQAMETLMETIKFEERNQLKALEWALNEITDNVLNHSESIIGGIMQIQSFPSRDLVSFFVVDAGLGIPHTLRKDRTDINSDTQALDRAIREGVTRNLKTNQGNGLYGTFKCCEVSEGSMTIISNHAVLNYANKYLSINADAVPFRGSFIRATINYSTERLLEKALIFKGRIHEPENDYIDMHYEFLEDKIVFYVLAESEGLGTRDAGRRVRQKIDNILLDKRNAILFDFSGIPLISSSFADEVFAQLFAELGALEFMRRCSFRAVDSTVRSLIDRAIQQRMKTEI